MSEMLKENGGSPYFVGVTSMAGLNFLLKCNYDKKHCKDLPVFQKNILDYFNDLNDIKDETTNI